MDDDNRRGSDPHGYQGALRSYLKSIRKFRLLTTTGELRVAAATRKGSRKAREKLVQSNLRLVVRIAREYRRTGVVLEDLIAEGNIGLMEASRRFDPTRGVRFANYAAWWIRKYILAAMQRRAAQDSMPAGRTTTGKAATRRDGKPRRLRILSLNELIREFSDRDPLETVTAAGGKLPEEIVLGRQLAEALRRTLPKLSHRERMILEAHYGLDGRPPRTLSKIGESLGKTRERVRQLELRALERARNLLQSAPHRRRKPK